MGILCQYGSVLDGTFFSFFSTNIDRGAGNQSFTGGQAHPDRREHGLNRPAPLIGTFLLLSSLSVPTGPGAYLGLNRGHSCPLTST